MQHRLLVLLLLVVVCVTPHVAYGADWGAVAARDNRATILLTTAWKEGDSFKDGFGTGFVIDAQGHILTVAHIFPRSSSGEVLITGRTEKWGTLYPKQEFKLRLISIDRDEDFAILVPDGDAPVLTPAPLTTLWQAVEGDSVHIRGFPLGVELIAKDGTISRSGMSSKVPTDAIIQAGFSGAPTYRADGVIIGMARGGDPVANITDPTVMGHGFFVPIALIEPLLGKHIREGIQSAAKLTASVPAKAAAAAEIRLSYQIDETKETSYSGLQDLAKPASTKSYVLGPIAAQPGYKIVRYEFLEHSATAVSNKKVTIAPDGSSIQVTYDLTSGPGFDRTRGWLEATVVTIQKAR